MGTPEWYSITLAMVAIQPWQGLVNVPIKHHPTIGDMIVQQIFEGDVKQIPNYRDIHQPLHDVNVSITMATAKLAGDNWRTGSSFRQNGLWDLGGADGGRLWETSIYFDLLEAQIDQ